MPYVTIHGLATYYEVSGDGPALLLLHAGFCSLESIRAQINALARRFRVHAFDRPGHGRTADRSGSYHYDTMVRDTVVFMDALGVVDAHLVGASDGAIIALQIAREYPKRVRSIVVISANLDPDGFVADETTDPATPSPDRGPLPDPANDEAVEQRLREQHATLSPDGPEHHQVVLKKLVELWRTEPHISARSLAAVRAPTLVIAAEHDTVRAEHTLLITRSIPKARVCFVPRSTHLTLVEAPQSVTAIVEQFHAGLPSLTAGFL